MHNENRHYVIFEVSEVDRIDFSEVMEDSADTLRLSVDGLKSFAKYEGEMPASLKQLTTASAPKTHDEISTELQTFEWLIEQDWDT